MIKDLIKNYVKLASGGFLSSFFSLLTTIITISSIGLINFGQITFAISVVSLISLVFSFQSGNTVIKFANEIKKDGDEKRINQIFSQSFLQDIFNSIIVFIILLFLSYFFYLNDSSSSISQFIFILSFSSIFLNTTTLSGILRFNSKYSSLTLIVISTSLVKFFLVFLYINLDFHNHVIGFIYIEVVTNILTFILFFFFNKNTLKISTMGSFFDKFNLSFFKFSFLNHFVQIIDIPTGEITKILVNFFLGPYQLALYTLLQRIGTIVVKFVDPLSIILFSEISKIYSSFSKLKAINFSKNLVLISFFISFLFILVLFLSFNFWSFLILDVYIKKSTIFFYIIFLLFTSSTFSIHHLFVILNLIKYTFIIVFISQVFYLLSFFYLIVGLDFGIDGLILSLFIQSFFVVFIKILVILKINTN